MRKAFSLVEVILAVGIFVAFSSAAMYVAIQGFSTNRLGSEQTVASQYASEGLEAMRSIRNQAYTGLVVTAATGVTRSGSGVWSYAGTNNTFGKYTRILKVEAVSRNASGDIVSTGGTVDADTKKITSTVSWNFIGQRNNSVVLTTYLTNWKTALSITSCATFCQTAGAYTTGTCRNTINQCTNNNETHEAGGTTYCTGTPKRCCCR